MFHSIKLVHITSENHQTNEQDSRFYIGLSVSNIAAEEGGTSTQELGLTVVGGYNYSQYLSTELSLFNLGEHKELPLKI